jgi:phosphoglycerol geranylgeranyltransferase
MQRKIKFKNVWKNLTEGVKKNGAGHLVLLDPDKESPSVLAGRAGLCEEAGVDALLVGGSYMRPEDFIKATKEIYRTVSLPVILFPGEAAQVTEYADAILFMSLLSGRNPDFLISQQVAGAPLVKKFGLEVIPTGYMLIESGEPTAVQRASKTKPIPQKNSVSAAHHALTAEYFGMQAVYLEAGSGARRPVPDAMITRVAAEVSISVIVGGGIRTPAEAQKKIAAGANFIVTGTVFERTQKNGLIREMAEAIKTKRRKR